MATNVERLERAVELLSERVTKLERAMYWAMGIGSATGITALFNLLTNINDGKVGP